MIKNCNLYLFYFLLCIFLSSYQLSYEAYTDNTQIFHTKPYFALSMLLDDAATIEKKWVGGDRVTYIQGARELYENNTFGTPFYLNTRPPGVYLKHYVAWSLIGESAPLILFEWIIVCALFAACLLILSMLPRNLSLLPSLMIPLLLFFSTITFTYYLSGGIMLPEPMGYGLLFLSFISFGYALHHRSQNFTVISGLTCGLACYWRAQIRLALTPLLYLFICLLIFGIFLYIREKSSGDLYAYINKKLMNGCLRFVTLFFSAYLLVTVPYQLYRLHHYGDARWMPVRYDYMLWDKPERIKPWAKRVGMGLPCAIDRITCDKIHNDLAQNKIYPVRRMIWLTLRTVLLNFDTWITKKYEIWSYSWFRPYHLTVPSLEYHYFENAMLILLIPLSYILGWYFLWGSAMSPLFIFYTFYSFIHFSALFLIHNEARYFYPLKTLCVLFLLILTIIQFDRSYDKGREPEIG